MQVLRARHWVGARPGPLALAFSPDGRRLAAQDPRDGVFVFEPPVGSLGAVAFDPAGFRCAAVAADGQVVIWDVDG
jgi:hypothetical protein